MPPCAAAAAQSAINARRAEDVRKKAEAALHRDQQKDGDVTPGSQRPGGFNMEDLRKAALEFQEKEVVPHYTEGLRASPRAEAVMGKDGRVYQSTSLFCLKPGDEPRRTWIFLVESKPFDPIILITIICNCITMAWECAPLAQTLAPRVRLCAVRL